MRFGRFNNAAKGMVDELFEAQVESQIEEARQTQISVKLSLSTAAMLTVLSELFGQSRFGFSGEILEDFSADLFFNLPEDKRAEIALKADNLTTEMLSKQGITVRSQGPEGSIDGDQTWRSLNSSKSIIEAYAVDNKEAA